MVCAAFYAISPVTAILAMDKHLFKIQAHAIVYIKIDNIAEFFAHIKVQTVVAFSHQFSFLRRNKNAPITASSILPVQVLLSND
jgi:hypothetical protein